MGWYPDPAGSDKERYWDGSRWTRNLRTPVEQPKSRRPHSNTLPETLEPIRRRQPGERPEQRIVQRRSANPAERSPQRSAEEPSQPQQPQQLQQPQEPQPPQQHNPYDAYRPQRSAGRLDASTSDGVPLAGWWWRVLSTVIDQIIIWVLVAILMRDQFQAYFTAMNKLMVEYGSSTQMLTALRDNPDLLSTAGLTGPLSTLMLSAIVAQAIYQFIMLVAFSASVGQLVAGLRVVGVGKGQQHRHLTWWRAAVRAATWGVVAVLNIYLGMLTVLSYVMPLFQRRRQTIHDLAGGTQVIRLSRN